MRPEIANNAAGNADELHTRNRRVGLLALAVALLLALGTVAYVVWLGGAGSGPGLGSAIAATRAGAVA